jgi:3-hydroxyacyl-CoA dehydrogenase/enoyl-CoA hydratase/3-hydroxybutyryl-CoA epimerase
VAKILFEAYGERMKPETALAGVVKDGRQGRKNKRGFYTYDGKNKKQVDETVYLLLPGGARCKAIDMQEVQQRAVLQMVNEAMHCLGEGILSRSRDGDIGTIFGLGFPPFSAAPSIMLMPSARSRWWISSSAFVIALAFASNLPLPWWRP